MSKSGEEKGRDLSRLVVGRAGRVMAPDVLAHVTAAVQDYRTRQAAPAPAPAHGTACAESHAPAADTGQPPSGEAEPGRPQAG